MSKAPRSPAAFQQLRTLIGYPDLPLPIQRDWNTPLAGYHPVPYTAHSVKTITPDWSNPDPEAVWARAIILSEHHLTRDLQTGLPRNPAGRTGISGHGKLYYLGPNLTSDLGLTYEELVLLIERTDTGQLAFPGGFREPLSNNNFENALIAATRETYQETDIRIPNIWLPGNDKPLLSGVAELSLRNTDDAWIENQAYHLDITDLLPSPPRPRAKDDAKTAIWFPLFKIDLTRMSDTHAEIAEKLQAQLRQS